MGRVDWKKIKKHLNAELGWALELRQKVKVDKPLSDPAKELLENISSDDQRTVYRAIHRNSHSAIFHFVTQIEAVVQDLLQLGENGGRVKNKHKQEVLVLIMVLEHAVMTVEHMLEERTVFFLHRFDIFESPFRIVPSEDRVLAISKEDVIGIFKERVPKENTRHWSKFIIFLTPDQTIEGLSTHHYLRDLLEASVRGKRTRRLLNEFLLRDLEAFAERERFVLNTTDFSKRGFVLIKPTSKEMREELL